MVNPCSTAYVAGKWTGFGLTMAPGIGGGVKAAGAKAVGKEFSHFVPERLARRVPQWLGGETGSLGRFLRSDSILNGNYVSELRHFKHDFWRRLGGTRITDKFLPGIQQLDRIPWVYRGGALGTAWGLAGMEANSGCP